MTKTFGSVTAVRDLNLQVAPGTLFGFLGPNGSGKSTTVKLLTGLLAPTAGEVRRRRAYCFAREHRAPTGDRHPAGRCGALSFTDDLGASGTERTAVWLEPRGNPRARAIQLLRHLDLERDSGTYIDQASYGMRKKCALAMALLHNPRILFLDEPFEGIDPGSSRNIKDLLVALAGKGRHGVPDLAHPRSRRAARRAVRHHHPGRSRLLPDRRRRQARRDDAGGGLLQATPASPRSGTWHGSGSH